MRTRLPSLFLFLLVMPWAGATAAEQSFSLSNDRVTCVVRIVDGVLAGDRLAGVPLWLKREGQGQPVSVSTDASFGVDVMYADWRAPGRQNNGDNPVILGPGNFRFVSKEDSTADNGTEILTLYFKGVDHSIDLRVRYRLDKDAPTLRTEIAVRDTSLGEHFVRWLWSRRGKIEGQATIVDPGAFGQPVAIVLTSGSAFFGLEFPSSENSVDSTLSLRCGQEIGERIGREWIASNWVAEGLAPDKDVRRWFFTYLDEIRVAPLRPYVLYNSWYDLRSPEYPHVPKENIMSEESALRMVSLLRDNMVRKHGIPLDAFVLDDGWDTYESDWVLRKEQWPHGLRPLAATLKTMNTSLGLWLGPIGGYSFRSRRIAWMRSHGYEVVGDQLCVAGKRYSTLLKNRVTDFTRNDDVGYFKWDGIQFVCNQPDHGHPIDVYSRRAALQSVIAMCRSVREAKPSAFLNITSGTWLSPWWLQYANTIWMDGEDYGYADVPSISKRDAAITYRDFVLYEDFHLKGLWFPVANLMTHGIIKGKLEMLGSADEPLDKFTDDVLLYVARGVSMYELYISPDIMSDGEWTSIARSLAWAKDRFPILMHTEMVGGNPLQRQAYGYAHFDRMNGIIAARNPVVDSQRLNVALTTALGLETGAAALVLERVYPTRWIAPRTYRTGDTVSVPLDAFETAVYEMYPLKSASWPLLAGVVFGESPGSSGKDVTLTTATTGNEVRILNPDRIASVTVDGHSCPSTAMLPMSATTSAGLLMRDAAVKPMKNGVQITSAFSTQASALAVAVLLTPSNTSGKQPRLEVRGLVDGVATPASEGNPEGISHWFVIPVNNASREIAISFSASEAWSGKAGVYVIGMAKPASHTLTMKTIGDIRERILPPRPWPIGEVRETAKLGETPLTLYP